MSYLTGQNFRGLRVLVLTGAVTCITIAGTQYGAGLKTEHERSQVLILFPFPFLPSFFFFFFFLAFFVSTSIIYYHYHYLD